MSQKDHWPFTPVNLSDIIGKDLLEIITSGYSERYQRVFTLLDHGTRIESINYEARFESFCALFRNEERVQGGNRLCELCDEREARKSLEWLRERNDPMRTYRCHMGLQEGIYVIQVYNYPVAFLFSGQYRPPDGIEEVRRHVEALGTGAFQEVTLTDATRQELISLAEELPTASEDVNTHLKAMAEDIQRIAEAEHSRRKHEREQAFLRMLRDECSLQTSTLEQLRDLIETLLKVIVEYCGCEYAVFFTNLHMGDTVLIPLAVFGIPEEIRNAPPHFNWRKAGLPLQEEYDVARHVVNYQSETPDASISEFLDAITNEMIAKGIRGNHYEYFANASCILPASQNPWHRCVLILGPFATPTVLSKEWGFLINVCNTLGFYVFMQLEIRELQQERERWQRAARMLLHQVGTELTPITTHIGRAKYYAKQLKEKTRVIEFIEHAEDLCLKLSNSTKKTLESSKGDWEQLAVQVHPEDLELELYPLSALIVNCVEGFTAEAERRGLELILDQERKVETLPDVEIDFARFLIAINNILSNAMKYSVRGAKVVVRARTDALENPREPNAVISISNIGFEIKEQDKLRIFEPGVRVLEPAVQERIPGSGLGLWETRTVVRAHGGEVQVSCTPTRSRKTGINNYMVTFTMKFPTRQKEKHPKEKT